MKLPQLAGCSLALLAVSAASGPSDKEEVIRLAEGMTQAGFELKVQDLLVEVQTPEEARQRLETFQDLYYPSEHFHCLWRLYRSLGLSLGEDPGGARSAVSAGMTSGLAAYCDLERNAMVLLENRPDNRETVLIHELVHARRFQRSGRPGLGNGGR